MGIFALGDQLQTKIEGEIMPTLLNKLTAIKVTNTTEPGLYADGGNLYLQISKRGSKSWIFRYRRNGRLRDMGLGSFPTVSLADARKRATAHRNTLTEGKDPLYAKKQDLIEQKLKESESMTFMQCAETYIDIHKAGWSNQKHIDQWTNTLNTYVKKYFGDKPVRDVDVHDIDACLKPIWEKKTETATRIRGRIESILDWATVKGYRKGDNPARWKETLRHMLSAPTKIRKVRHHPALPYSDIQKFVQQINDHPGVTSYALRFTILTACRTSEVIKAKWHEIDMDGRVWSIPEERMKMKRPHRVPLTDEMMKILRSLELIRSNDYLFPGQKENRPISNISMLVLLKRMNRSDITVHGFRSTFRDWAAETTEFSGDVVEMALAHKIQNDVEAAYRRGDLLEKRRALMVQWNNYCCDL